MTEDKTPIPQDEYSTMLRKLRAYPSVVEKQSVIERQDFYGNTESWIVRTLRGDHADETVFLVHDRAAGGQRYLLPPEVVAAIVRQHDAIGDTIRKRGARQAAATRKASGHVPFLRKAK